MLGKRSKAASPQIDSITTIAKHESKASEIDPQCKSFKYLRVLKESAITMTIFLFVIQGHQPKNTNICYIKIMNDFIFIDTYTTFQTGK